MFFLFEQVASKNHCVFVKKSISKKIAKTNNKHI